MSRKPIITPSASAPKKNKVIWIIVPALVIALAGGFFLIKKYLPLGGSTMRTADSASEADKFSIYPTDFKEVSSFKEFDGKLAVSGRLQDGNYAVYYDGKKMTTYPGPVNDFFIRDGKVLASIASPTLATSKIIFYDFDGKKAEAVFADGYDFIYKSAKNSNGSLSFSGQKDARWWLESWDIKKDFRSVLDMININGTLAYSVENDNRQRFIYYGEKVFGPYNDGANDLLNINGQLAFTAEENHKGYVILGDEKYGPYEYVYTLINAGGQPAFTIKQAGKDVLLINGEQTGNAYDSIVCETPILNSVLFKARVGGIESLVLAGNPITGIDTDRNFGDHIKSCPKIIDNKLAYVARRERWDFVYFDSKELGPYSNVGDDIISVNGKPTYIVTINKNQYVYSGDKETALPANFTAVKIFNAGVTWGAEMTDSPVSDDAYIFYNSEIFGPYQTISKYLTLDNKLIFTAQKMTNGKREKIMFFDGNEFSQLNIDLSFDDNQQPNAKLTNIQLINDKENGLAFEADYTYKSSDDVVYENEKIISDAYDQIPYFDNIQLDDGYAYTAIKGGKYYIIKSGKPFAGPFGALRWDEIRSLTSINGRLAFSAKVGDKYNVYLGAKDGFTEYGPFSYVSGLYEYNKEILYTADYAHYLQSRKICDLYDDQGGDLINDGKHIAYTGTRGHKKYLCYDGHEKEIDFDGVTEAVLWNDKPVYVAYKNIFESDDPYAGISGIEMFLVIDGKIVKSPYDHFIDLTVIDGKLTYLAFKDKQNYIVYGDKTFGPYDLTFDPSEGKRPKGQTIPIISTNNQLVYTAYKQNDHKAYVFAGEKEIGPYDHVSELEAVGDKFVFWANKGDDDIVYFDGKEMGGQYEYVWPEIIGNKAAAVASNKNGNKYFFYDDLILGPFSELGSPNYTKYSKATGNRLNFVGKKGGEWYIYQEK